MRRDLLAAGVVGVGLALLAWFSMRPSTDVKSAANAEHPERALRPKKRAQPLVFTRPEPEVEAAAPAGGTLEDGDTGSKPVEIEKTWDGVEDVPEEVRREVYRTAGTAISEVMAACAPELVADADRLMANVSFTVDEEGLKDLAFGSMDLDAPSARARNEFPPDFSDCANTVLWEQDWPTWERDLKVSFIAPVLPSGDLEPPSDPGLE